MDLKEALAALEREYDDAALRFLLCAWRKEPLSQIADLIDVLSDRITAKREAIAGKTQKARAAKWKAIEAKNDPSDAGRLLAMPWPRRWIEARPFLTKIEKWPSDPRVAMGLAERVEGQEWKLELPVYGDVLGCLQKIGDVRVLPALEERHRSKRSGPKEVIAYEPARSAIRELRAQRDKLGSSAEPKDMESWKALTSHFHAELTARATKARGEQDLLTAIHADPDNDDVRQVYADFLSERGDPRGEFITLQLTRARGEANPAMVRREHALLTKHIKTWTSSEALRSAAMEETYVFERGFLSSVTLSLGALSVAEHVFQRDPIWTTVRSIDCFLSSAAAFFSILTSPKTLRLRSLLGLTENIAAWLVGPTEEGGDFTFSNRRWNDLEVRSAVRRRAAETLEEIGIGFSADVAARTDRVALGAATNVPHLKSLKLEIDRTDHDPSWLFDGALWPRLERLCVTRFPGAMAKWIERARLSKRMQSIVFESVEWRAGHWRAEFRNDNLRALHIAWIPGPTRGYQQIGLLEEILRVAAEVKISSLIIEPSRSFRPALRERESLEKAITALGALEHIEVPWRESAPATTTPTMEDFRSADNFSARADLYGDGLLGATEEVLQTIESANLLPAFDTFEANYGVARTLGAKPRERLLTWSKRDATRQLFIYRDGFRETCELRLLRSSRSKEDVLIYPLVNTAVTCGVPADAKEGPFVARYIDWLKSFLEAFEVVWGAVSVPTVPGVDRVLPALEGMEATCKVLAWIVIFGERSQRLLPRKELLALPSKIDAFRSPSSPSLGVSVHTTRRNVILVTAPSPRTVLTDERVAAIERALSDIYRAAFAKAYGYDPHSYIAERLEPALAQLGFTRHRERALTPSAAAWTRKRQRTARGPGEIVDGFVLRLITPSSQPAIEVVYKSIDGAEAPPVKSITSYWPSQWNLYPEDRTICSYGFAAHTLSQVNASLDDIAKCLRGQIESWYLNQDPPFPSEPPSSLA